MERLDGFFGFFAWKLGSFPLFPHLYFDSNHAISTQLLASIVDKTRVGRVARQEVSFDFRGNNPRISSCEFATMLCHLLSAFSWSHKYEPIDD